MRYGATQRVDVPRQMSATFVGDALVFGGRDGVLRSVALATGR